MDHWIIFSLEWIFIFLLYTFPFVILLFNEYLFGINMVFLTRLIIPYLSNKDFLKVFSLFLTTIGNYIAMIDHTTFCMNSLYSVLLYLGLLFYGTLFLYSYQIIEPKKLKEETFSYYTYGKVLLICIADILLYSNLNKEWYLFVCFVSFLNGLGYRIKIGIYLSGFIINIIIGEVSLYNWMVYLGFYLLLSALTIWGEGPI